MALPRHILLIVHLYAYIVLNPEQHTAVGQLPSGHVKMSAVSSLSANIPVCAHFCGLAAVKGQRLLAQEIQ